MFSLSAARARELVDQVWRVGREWREFFDKAGVSAKDIAKIDSAFRRLDAVSTVAPRKLLA